MKKIISIALISIFLIIISLITMPSNVKNKPDYTIVSNKENIKNFSKADVKEFFSFGCSHCREIDPLVEKTLALNPDINLEKIQVVFGNRNDDDIKFPKLRHLFQILGFHTLIQLIWGDSEARFLGFARLNATLTLLHLNQLYAPAFTSVAKWHDLDKSDELKAFLVQNQLSQNQVNKFIETYNSLAVNNKILEYKYLTDKYVIVRTPTFIINGKYIIMLTTPEHTIKVIESLILIK